jgi:predicted ATPase
MMLADSYYWLGDLTEARGHFERSLSLYDLRAHGPMAFQYGFDAKTLCLHYLSWTLWALGYPDQASDVMRQSLKAAREVGHLFSIAHAMGFELYLQGFRREPEGVRELAENLIALSKEQGFPHWAAQGLFWRGWACAAEGRSDEDLAQMREGAAGIQATGANICHSIRLAFLIESYARAGQVGEGLRAVDEALSFIERHGERPHEAEFHRLKGELLLSQETPHAERAEACFQTAIEIARRRQAKLLELRATTSLARMWQRQNKRDDARRLLGEVYGWFTEGFGTLDLREAKALLRELA